MGFIAVKCPACGADIQLDDSREFGFCNYCGAKVVQDKVIVEHRGSVKVDESEKLENLYVLARRARDDNNTEKASKYYDEILQQDPNSWEAIFYSVYFQSMNCKIAEIRSAAIRICNSEDTILKLVKENVTDPDELGKVLNEIVSKCIHISTALYNGAMNHYDGISRDIQYKYNNELVDRCLHCCYISYFLGDSVETMFGEQYAKTLSVKCWKDGITGQKNYMNKIAYIETRDSQKAFLMKYVQKVKKYDTSYMAPNTQPSGGCYVATCVYGSYDCPQVWTLRRYRDDTLASTWYGRTFIRTYYAVSPTLVAWFGHTDWFKKLWRGKLDRMVESLRENGVADTPYEDKTW